MLLKDMSSPQIDALDRASTVVLYPVGPSTPCPAFFPRSSHGWGGVSHRAAAAWSASVEQHSLHLPVFVDSMICEEVAARTHARIPEQVLVLPTQHIG